MMMGDEGEDSSAGDVAAVFGVVRCSGVVGCTVFTGVDGMRDETGNTYMMTMNKIVVKAYVGLIICTSLEVSAVAVPAEIRDE